MKQVKNPFICGHSCGKCYRQVEPCINCLIVMLKVNYLSVELVEDIKRLAHQSPYTTSKFQSSPLYHKLV